MTEATASPTRHANKAQSAEWFGISPQAFDGWIRRGCPAVQRGGAGKPWTFDLLEVARWRFGPTDAATGAIDPAKLSPKDRLDHWRAVREETRHRSEAGELIPAEQFARAMAGAIKTLAIGLDTLPDLLEREGLLDGAAVARAIRAIDGFREELYRRLLDATGKTD